MWQRISTWTQNRWFRRAISVVGWGILIWLLLPGLLNVAARQLMREDTLVRADLIISLSGDLYCERERKAAALYNAGWAPQMIASGYSFGPGLDTSTGARAYLLSLGVPEDNVLALPGGTNTRVEAAQVSALMRTRGWRTAIIVTSPFHARRALFTFERAAPDLTFISAPVAAQAPEWQPDRWWSRRGDFGLTVREFFSWVNTLITGWK